MHQPATEYAITTVFGRVNEPLRQEATAFWLQNGAITSAGEALRRSGELVCVARGAAGEIVGVNTAYVSGLRSEQDRYFHYRMFVRPQDRRLQLSCALVRAAVDALREGRDPQAGIRGVALVTENQKLMRRGGRRMLERLGWQRLGTGPRGLDVWTIDFD